MHLSQTQKAQHPHRSLLPAVKLCHTGHATVDHRDHLGRFRCAPNDSVIILETHGMFFKSTLFWMCRLRGSIAVFPDRVPPNTRGEGEELAQSFFCSFTMHFDGNLAAVLQLLHE